MINLNGKVVLITGGSKGIGKACVKLFYRANADVAFTYYSGKKESEQLEELLNGKGKIKAYNANVANEREVEQLVENVLEDFGKVDILINNAGIWEPGPIDDTSLENWNRTIETNLTSMFLVTKEVVPIMKKNKFGRIINISSTAGQRGEANYSNYAASKGGMISFTKSLAAELGEYNITTNSVAPGWVYSEMTKTVFDDKDYEKNEIQKIPLKRIADAEDIAGPCLFLASDLAKHINGEILNVNGGSVLCG
jgi:3-oxoacyl-[acyl-carrier protein] reductase